MAAKDLKERLNKIRSKNKKPSILQRLKANPEVKQVKLPTVILQEGKEGIPGMPGPQGNPGSSDTAEDVRNKLMSLPEGDRLPATFIRAGQ